MTSMSLTLSSNSFHFQKAKSVYCQICGACNEPEQTFCYFCKAIIHTPPLYLNERKTRRFDEKKSLNEPKKLELPVFSPPYQVREKFFRPPPFSPHYKLVAFSFLIVALLGAMGW